MLPQMLPLRLRNQSEFGNLRAQEQYAPFRATEFSLRDDDECEGSRAGPGALFREEWNSMAVTTQKRALSLYRSDRDVNPTVEATVQRFYDAHAVHDLGAQMTKRGNNVSALKSATPRFESPASGTGGPGAYSSERFHGAFPLLLEHMTPAAAMLEKQAERAAFESAFAVQGTSRTPRGAAHPSPSPRKSSQSLAKPLRASAFHSIGSTRESPPRHPHRDGFPLQHMDASDTTLLESPLQSARLVVALTPRNAYSSANRQLLLTKGSSPH